MAYNNKFVSVNLNKSYGQPSSSSSFSHGQSRPASGGGGRGGGMVVLSRSRTSSSSSAKTAPRLAVPPPLNLPSLRKEHERSDPASSASAAGRGGGGVGLGSGSSAMGWSKPAQPPPPAEKQDGGPNGQLNLGRSVGDRFAGGGAYVPPGSRSDGQYVSPAAPVQGFSDKAVILRGEEFPSLKATVILASKPKDSSSQKQKLVQDGQVELQADPSEASTSFQMRPQMKSALSESNSKEENGGSSRVLLGASKQAEKFQSGPLPDVQLRHTSDWADDERDTALSIPERDRYRGYSRSEAVLFNDSYESRGPVSDEFYKGDSFGRDVKSTNRDTRDSGSWRSPLQSRDRFNRDSGADRDRPDSRPLSGSRETGRQGITGQASSGDGGCDGSISASHIQYTKRDLGSPIKSSNGRVSEQNSRLRYGDNYNNWHKGSSLQSNSMSKGQFPLGNRGGSLGDSFSSVVREKRSNSSSGKPYLEDSGFDSKDPFSWDIRDVNVKMLKRKKDVANQADFYDPVRKTFEAELENILMVQEQERERVLKEQTRALEHARKEEERLRLAREEDERRRLLEEEARNNAWKEELQKLEAARKAEDQRIAREEERRRYQIEEERRKEAAKQKLLELEAKMARRHTEDKVKDDRSTLSNDRMTVSLNERSAPRTIDVRDWEDNERMIEQVASSASSDSSYRNKYFEGDIKPQSSRDGNISLVDRGKYPYSTTFPPELDSAHQNPQRDSFVSRRIFPKNDLCGNLGTMSARPSIKVGTTEASPISDDYHQVRQQRWSTIRDNDHVKRYADTNTDFLGNDRFGELGWARSNSHGSPHAQFAERPFQNSESEDIFSATRYRQFLRQPRVPPPPSMTHVQRSHGRAPLGRENSSTYGHTHYNHPGRSEIQNLQTGYDNMNHEAVGQLETTPLQEEVMHSENKIEKLTEKCDSQSSVSVSSPPSSPVPLSHDEMYVAGDFPKLPTSADGEQTAFSDNEHTSTVECGVLDRITSSRSVSPNADDDWGVGSNKDMQHQEDYDEEDDYREIDETHEGEYYNLDLSRDLEDLRSDLQAASSDMEQVILGFDDGVQVKIPRNNEMEMASKQSDGKLKVHAATDSGMEELVKNSEIVFPVNNANSNLTIISETEKAMQDLSLDTLTKMSCSVNSDDCLGTGMPVQHASGSTTSLPLASSSTVPPIFSSYSPVGQSETSVKLQFGLFSGPTLIPPPVPAIQIGSIQTPIPVYPQINPSLSQVHPSQSPLFQFGQLRHPVSISQSILPLAPLNMPFIQPQSSAPYSFNRNPVGSLSNQSAQDHISHDNMKNGKYNTSAAKQQGPVPVLPNPSQEKMNYKQPSGLQDTVKDSPTISQNQRADLVSQAEHNGGYPLTAKKSHRFVSGKKDSQFPGPTEPQYYRLFRDGKVPSKTPAVLSSIRGKKYACITGSKSSMQDTQTSQADANNIQRRGKRQIQRTEFRVRENVERRQIERTEPVDNVVQDERQSSSDRNLETPVENLSKKGTSLYRSKKITEREYYGSGTSVSQVQSYDDEVEKNIEKVSSSRNSDYFDKSHAEGNMKMSGNFEEDVDAPLQSGIVRVFKQPGIEIPNDEDDFIEVRYKRRMLNHRREQKEKENKSKSRINKAPRKQRAIPPVIASSSVSQKLGGDSTKGVNSNSAIARGVLGKLEQPQGFITNMISQPMPSPVAASAVDDTGISSDKKLSRLMQISAVSGGGKKLETDLVLENNNSADEGASAGINSWDKRNMDQQVMTLTQTQLDEAMKPAQFDSRMASNIAVENNKSMSSTLAQENSVAPSTSPINSLLAGDKIQFGALTSSAVLPMNRNVSIGLGAPGSSRSDGKLGQTLVSASNDCTLFFGKNKHGGDSCAHLEDSDAEAAASAVAVAAISIDESVCPITPQESASADLKNFSNVSDAGLTSGGLATRLDRTGQPGSEEPLTVALPADLSVDTPSLSLWPSLPSPQTSGPMLSHFPGAPPSSFPCFEVNPLLGGRIFAYGPHDESAGTQGQSQRSLGIWPQCHSGVDSFYGHPAGFSGTFIGPGGIPGVQGPPHMVVYNHLAPVGQFGQLGLSFMGTTFIPTGKQTEWQQNQVSESEGDLCNATAVSGQAASPSMATASLQHVAPGSAIMQMPPPLTMFDATPFQPTANMPLQGRWSHVSAPPVHSVPLSLPPQQQHHVKGAVPPQLNQNLAVTSSGNNRFNEHRQSVLADVSRNILGANSASSQLSDQLGVVHQSASSSAGSQTIRSSHGSVNGNRSVSGNSRGAKTSRTSGVGNAGGIGTSSSSNIKQSIAPASKSHLVNASSGQRYTSSVGFANQLGGASMKLSASNELHRRTGFEGRSQSSGGEKNFGASKLKQIYVVKASSGGHSSSQG